MRKKIFQNLKKILCSFFICFSLNFRSVKATENNMTCETITIRCPERMFKRRFFRIRINKNQNNLQEDFESKNVKGKRVGGYLTGTTYEKFQKQTLLWLDDYEKKNKILTKSKVPIVKIPPKIESTSTNFNILKEKNSTNNKILFFFVIFSKN